MTSPSPAASAGWANPCSADGRSHAHLVPILGVGGLVPIAGGRNERIAAVAERQRGRIKRAQLRALAIPDSTISRLLEEGRLVREHRGVYIVRPAVDVPLGAETSALLACGPNALLSHGSAASLWKLRKDVEGSIEVTVSHRRAHAVAGVKVHRTRHLLARDVRVEQGLPVTSPARTLLDRAATLTTHALERELDEALVVLEIVTRRELEDVVSRASGRRGASELRRLLAGRERDTLTKSEAERGFLALVRQARLPEPQTQVPLAGYTVDFLWPEQRVVFEIDGYRFHISRRAFDRDRRKDLALKAARYDPNRVSRDQVANEPLVVLAHVAGALARAGAGGDV